MKQLYFAVPFAKDIKFTVINDENDEIANFHLIYHESEFGGEGLVTLIENGNVLETRIINTGVDNDIDFVPVISEVDESIIYVNAIIDTNGMVIVSVK